MYILNHHNVYKLRIRLYIKMTDKQQTKNETNDIIIKVIAKALNNLEILYDMSLNYKEFKESYGFSKGQLIDSVDNFKRGIKK